MRCPMRWGMCTARSGSPRAGILPLNTEHLTFGAALLVADGAIAAGRSRVALIVCGGAWSTCVSYETAQSVSAGDGAGAAILARGAGPDCFRVVDAEWSVRSSEYGTMYLAADEGTDGRYSAPYFHILTEGLRSFVETGGEEPPAAARRLLARHGLSGGQVILACHQASAVLLDRWVEALRPARCLETLAELGNMTLATVPVNLSLRRADLDADWLLLLGVGVEFQTLAVLLRRRA